MEIEAGKPVIIRRKTKRTKNAASAATDKRTGFRMRLVKGQKQHTCAGPCPWPEQIIERGPYLVVTHPDWTKRIGRNHFPEERKYHPDCVPNGARPLVRFLIPTPWVMTLCEDSSQDIKSWRFTSVMAWRKAMHKHYPEMRKRWSYEGYRSYQVGMDYHWSMLVYKPRPFER